MRHARAAFLLAALLVSVKAPAQTWVKLNAEGLQFEERGSYRESENALLRAHELAAAHLGENTPTTAIILRNLAVIYMKTDRFTKAEGCFKQSLVTLQSTLGPEHQVVARTLNDLGALYFRLGADSRWRRKCRDPATPTSSRV